MGFYIEVQFGGATTGEIHTASYFNISSRLDEAGDFSFEMPLSDPNAALIVPKAIIICYHELAGAMVIFGAGIVDSIEVTLDGDGQPTGSIAVSGPDMLRELTYTHTGKHKINASTAGPAQLIAMTPTWSLSGSDDSTKTIKHQYMRETLLDAWIKLAEIDGGHIYYDYTAGLRNLMWVPGIGNYSWHGTETLRAFYGIDALAAEGSIINCGVTKLLKTSDSSNAMVGRVYAFGINTGDSALDLNGAAMGYFGYTLGHIAGKGYYLENTNTWGLYGIESVVNYPDEEDVQSLCERTYEEMSRQLVPKVEYDINVIGLNITVNVLDTVRLIAYQWSPVNTAYAAFSVNALLNVIEKTDRVDNAGARTVGMKLSVIDHPIRKNKHALNSIAKLVYGLKLHG
jgi:hypothetical protein